MLGKRIKKYRQDKGMSQQHLADILKVHNSSVSKWERGKSKPTYKSMIEMSETFNVNILDLMGDLKVDDLLKERESNWTVQKIIEKFNEYKESGLDITDKGIRNNYPILRFQIIDKFSSYRLFLESQGINYDDIKIYNTWSKERIIKEFNNLQKTEVELHINNLKENIVPY